MTFHVTVNTIDEIANNLTKLSTTMLFFTAILLMAIIVEGHHALVSIFESRNKEFVVKKKKNASKKPSMKISRSKSQSQSAKKKRKKSAKEATKKSSSKKTLQTLSTTNGCDKSETYLCPIPPESERSKQLFLQSTKKSDGSTKTFTTLVPPAVNFSDFKLTVPTIVREREKKQAFAEGVNTRPTTRELEELNERSEKVIKKV